MEGAHRFSNGEKTNNENKKTENATMERIENGLENNIEMNGFSVNNGFSLYKNGFPLLTKNGFSLLTKPVKLLQAYRNGKPITAVSNFDHGAFAYRNGKSIMNKRLKRTEKIVFIIRRQQHHKK